MAKKILIVEDDMDMRLFLKTLISTAGYEPTLCKNGKQGLEAARKIIPGCIVLDVMMPGEGGALMYTKLKQDKDLIKIPVIMLSAVARRSFVHYLKMQNVSSEQDLPDPDAYLRKPPEASDLLAAIGRLAGPAEA